eukprot:8717042-Heterocapsa_arctica.AAC.1
MCIRDRYYNVYTTYYIPHALVIRCTCLAQHVVAHPIVIARALSGSSVTPNMLMFYVFSDPLD